MILRKNNFNFLEKIDLKKIYLIILLILLMLQSLFWKKYKDIKVELGIVPVAYNDKTMKAFIFGDEQYYFRLKCLKIQNMGNTFGRFEALYKYDYKNLYNWIESIDKLDTESHFLPALSAYYFSQTQKIQDRRYVVDYLEKYSDRNIEKNWWWLYQAAYISQYSLKDNVLSIKIANKLKNLSGDVVPFWIRHTVALYLANLGQECESLRIINEMSDEYKELDKEKDEKKRKKKQLELDYMEYFIKNILDDLKNKKIDFNKCLNNEGVLKNE